MTASAKSSWTSAAWTSAALLAAGLLAAALFGWLVGELATAVAAVAVVEVIWLWHASRRPAPATAPAASSVAVLPAQRGASRSRRFASMLHDLRGAADKLPDAIVLLDRHQHIRWFNQAAEQLLGLRQPLDRGARLQSTAFGADIANWLLAGAAQPLNDVAAPGQPDSQLTLSALPLGRHHQCLLARDITHLNRLEQVRRDFVANVSHELRTPLTVIHGYLELIDPDDVPELTAVLGEMRAQSKRMGQIVEDLLTLSRLETQHEIADERVPMQGLLATVHKEAQALSQGRHEITLDAGLAADLLGSPKDLHSALSNLASNAVRYTPAGGRIAIGWRRVPDGAVYSVSDSGYGIPAAHLARLTERFYRISSSRSRDSGGTGLGLSIVKHVLGLHQARLQIESEPGVGSTFSCHFGHARLLAPEERDAH